jgi:hypothetical protein
MLSKFTPHGDYKSTKSKTPAPRTGKLTIEHITFKRLAARQKHKVKEQ